MPEHSLFRKVSPADKKLTAKIFVGGSMFFSFFKISLSLILFFLWSVLALAGQECAPLDLRPLLGPALDQGDSGYCFAHSSATLIRAHTGLAVSPMQLAVLYLLANPEELSGRVDPELNRRLNREFFHAWKTDRLIEPQNYDPKTILTENGLLNTGGEEFGTLLVANFFPLCPEYRLPAGKDVYKRYLESIREFHEQRIDQGISPEEFKWPIGEVIDPTARVMARSYRRWVETKCGATTLPSPLLLPRALNFAPNLKSFRRLQLNGLLEADRVRGELMAAVDRQLDRGHPVAIGYALDDLIPNKLLARSSTPSEVDHSSVLVARKKKSGHCYYFLRNSFGNDLRGYRPQFRGRLEDGGVWLLPEEVPSFYSAVWLQ